MECLLELDSEIVALKPVNGGGGKVVVLLRNKVLLVAGASGHVLWSCALAFAKRASAVDCLYFEDEELLVIACSDSSLQTVSPATGAVVSSVAWPTQPRALLKQQSQRGPAGALTFIICAEGAHVCQVSLQPGHVLPAAPALPSLTVAPTAVRKTKSGSTPALLQTPHPGEFYAACTVGSQSLSVAASFPGASLAAKSAVSIVTWSLAPIQVGTAEWLLSTDSGCNTVLLDGDSVLSLCAHPADAASLSVVVSVGRARSSSTSSLNDSSSSSSSSSTSSTSSSSNSGKMGKAKWIKLGLDGRVLFERAMQEAPLSSCMQASGSRALLWTLSSGVGQVSLRAWDACYGVSSFSHTERHNQAVSACFAVLPEGSGEAASNGAALSPSSSSSSSSSLLVTILLVANTPGGGSALLKTSLFPPPASLASALGQLAPPPPLKTKSTPESSGSAGKATKAKNTGPLNSLAPSVKRKLIQAAQRGEALERQEAEDEEKEARRANGSLEQDDTDEADKEGGAKKVARHSSASRPRRYLDVPMDSSRLFLSQLEETPAAEILTSDWDITKALIRAGIVSLSSNRSLISQAVQCQRIDVLSCVARFVTDLSEEQCVRMLKLCVCVPDHALERLCIEGGGALRWGSSSSAAAGGGAAATDAASPEAAPGKGKGKARRKSSSGPSSSTGQHVTTHLDLVRVVAESLLLRAGAFSSILLGEAIRKHLSPASSLLLLRVFVHMLRGLCAPCTDSSKVHLGQFRDQQVCRATCWAEGLLDAHFAATVLNITTHDAPTLAAVRSALDAVGQAKRASQSVETLLGLWTHIARAVSAGKDASAGPPASSYQLETLRL